MEDGITILPVPGGVELRAQIGSSAPAGAEQAARIDAVWEELRRGNDRLYDGPILRAVSVDVESGSLLCRRETYRVLAASARLGLGVRQLGVMGVITGRDSAGREHVLLARRAAQTRIYPGLWELAPSGGVTPPPLNVPRIGSRELSAALADEAEEELALDLSGQDGAAIAVLRDVHACSDDIVLRIELTGPIDPRRGVCPASNDAADRWEYLDVAWVAMGDLRGFVDEHRSAIAPPTRALLRWLGWV